MAKTRKRQKNGIEFFQTCLNQKARNAAFRAYAKAMSSAQVLERSLAFLLIGLQYEKTSETNLNDQSVISEFENKILPSLMKVYEVHGRTKKVRRSGRALVGI